MLKKAMKKILIFILSLFMVGIGLQAQQNNITLHISNIQANAGDVRIAVHNRANFLKDYYVTTRVLAATTNEMTVGFQLADGEYSFAIIQDFNRNGKMDSNMFGVPQEPYGFSNQVRPKFRAPTFDESKILISNNAKSIKIRLEKW
jgi:uncharacterized protein (DUF2141 family)